MRQSHRPLVEDECDLTTCDNVDKLGISEWIRQRKEMPSPLTRAWARETQRSAQARGARGPGGSGRGRSRALSVQLCSLQWD